MADFLNDLQRIGLTALFNPTFLFLLVILFFLGRLVGWMTRGLNIWKFIALGYFAIFLFRPLQDAGLVIGGIFVLGVASMYTDLFREIFRWSGGITDLFYAFRSPDVYRDIDRLEREIEDLKRQLHATQTAVGAGPAAQSATQQQWRDQAKARANKSKGGADSNTQQARSADAGAAARASGGNKRAGQKEKRHEKRSGGRSPGAGRAKASGATGQDKTAGRTKSQGKRDTGTKKQDTRAQQQSANPGGNQHSRSGAQQNVPPNNSGLPPSIRDRYLKALELTPGQTYTPQELKTAWRKMAFKTHPDRGGSAAAFNEAFNAYKALR